MNVLLWVAGMYVVSVELKSRRSYEVVSSLESGITYTVNRGAPSMYFGEGVRVP